MNVLTAKRTYTWEIFFLSVICDALGIFLIKFVLDNTVVNATSVTTTTWQYAESLASSPLSIVGIVLFFIAPFLFASALSRIEISIGYPLQVITNMGLLVLLAICFLGEQLTVNKSIGFALLALSIFLFFRR